MGAGFDSTYFRLHADDALDRAVVFEVDFPDVTRRKAALISSNITLRGMLDSHLPSLTGLVFVLHRTHVLFYCLFRSLERNAHISYVRFHNQLSACVSAGPLYVSSGQYHLLGVDVRQESQVEEALGAAGLDWAAPTLILSEVVLTYMETQW